MLLDEYQKAATATAIFPKAHGLSYTALGLNGEAGEVAEKIKKIIRDDGGRVTVEKRNALKKELGDVLWYLSQCAEVIGVHLSDIASENLAKLAERKATGTLQGSGDNREKDE